MRVCWVSRLRRIALPNAPHSRLDLARCGRASWLEVERARAGRRAKQQLNAFVEIAAGENTSRSHVGRHALRRQGHAANAGTSAERGAQRSRRSWDRREQRSAGPVGRGRRGSHRVHSNDRVGLRAFRLQCFAGPNQEPLEPGPRPRRLVVWIGGGGGERCGRRRARFGYGGSLRIPAHCCGVTAWKPTYGLISTRGSMPLAPSLDTISILSTKRGRSAAEKIRCDTGRSAAIATRPEHRRAP